MALGPGDSQPKDVLLTPRNCVSILAVDLPSDRHRNTGPQHSCRHRHRHRGITSEDTVSPKMCF